MSVITENNKDHLLNYEGVEQLLVKINDRFARTDRYATPDTLGMIKAEINTEISSEDISTSDNHPVQITTDGNAFVNINVPTIPSSLKNPHPLTVQGNGTTIDSYDGSSTKTINITPASIGADTKPFSTERDFENGTLIKTNIDYSVTNGVPFYVEIKGNTYVDIGSMFIQAQGYIYNDTIANYSVTSLGKVYPEQFIAINIDGNLCFWFPRIGYWHGYSVKVTTGYDYSVNCVTDVIDVVEPSGTKRVVLSNNYFINHGFDGSSGGVSINPAGNYLRPVYINGNNEAQPVEGIEDTLIKWKHPDRINPGDNLLSLFSTIDTATSQLHSANRLAFGNPNGITVEYSTDGGTTWVDYGLTDAQKINLISNKSYGAEIRAGKALNTRATANDKLRITINAATTGFYTSAIALYINFSTNGSEQCIVDVERAYRGSESNFTAWKSGLLLHGWSGWNKLPLGNISFGGGDHQTTNVGAIRLTISSNGASSSYTGGCHFSVYDLQLIGDTTWSTCSNMGKNGHLYDHDHNQNALFPANVSATTFIGNLSGNATSANKASAILSVTNGNTTTAAGTGEIIYSRFQNDMLGSLPGSDNANGVITINTHGGDYHHQLGFTGLGMFYRRRHGSELNDSESWSKIAMLSDIPTDYTRVGDGSMYIYPHSSNEINFGGTSTTDTIYFGYRPKDNKTTTPSKYVFGRDGAASVNANGFIKKDSSNSYVLLGGGGHKLLSDLTDDVVAGKYIPSTSYYGGNNANEQYNAGVFSGGMSNTPSGDPYGILFVLPYRKGSGNTTTDFAGQIYIPCGDDRTNPNDMFFRTSNSSELNEWNTWNKVITDKNIGSYKAGSAGTADSATNADTVDGKHASDFAVANHNHTIILNGSFTPEINATYDNGTLIISGNVSEVQYTGTTDVENTNANPESWFVETDDIRALFANEVSSTDTL